MTFRQAYRKDLFWRILDLAGHCTLAWLLPGLWWWQFLPDCVVPLLWACSMVLNRPLPEESRLLNINRFLHHWVCPFLVWVVLLVSRAPHGFAFLPIQWAMHLLLDEFTHKEWKRDLRSVQRGN